MLKLRLSFADAAAKSDVALPAKSDAPPASVAQRNRRRLMPLQTRSPFPSKAGLFIERNVRLDGIFSRTKFDVIFDRNIRPAAECCTPAACARWNDSFASIPAAPWTLDEGG